MVVWMGKGLPGEEGFPTGVGLDPPGGPAAAKSSQTGAGRGLCWEENRVDVVSRACSARVDSRLM